MPSARDDLRDEQLRREADAGDALGVVHRRGDLAGDERAVPLRVARSSRRRSVRARTMRLARSGCVASMPESITATFTGGSTAARPARSRRRGSCWRYHCFATSGSVGVNASRRCEPSHSTQRTPSMRRMPRACGASRRARRAARGRDSTVPKSRSCAATRGSDAPDRRRRRSAPRGRGPRHEQRTRGGDGRCADQPTTTFGDTAAAQPWPATTRARYVPGVTSNGADEPSRARGRRPRERRPAAGRLRLLDLHGRPGQLRPRSCR